MSRSVDISGVRFGSLTALYSTGLSIHGSKVWKFRCDCGNEIERVSGNVKSGHTKSCGCLKSGVSKTHGMSNTAMYLRWLNMRRRCEDENSDNFENYGGRGIKVCERWQSFQNLLDDMGEPTFSGAQIDRRDNDGDYEPSNCRWVTPKQNAGNRSNNRILTIDGEALSIVEWSDRSGISYSTIWARLQRGWSSKDAVFLPIGAKK